MRAISAAVVVLGGALLVSAATAPTLPEHRSRWVATAGFVVGLIGLVAWAVAYLDDRRRDRATSGERGHPESRSSS